MPRQHQPGQVEREERLLPGERARVVPQRVDQVRRREHHGAQVGDGGVPASRTTLGRSSAAGHPKPSTRAATQISVMLGEGLDEGVELQRDARASSRSRSPCARAVPSHHSSTRYTMSGSSRFTVRFGWPDTSWSSV